MAQETGRDRIQLSVVIDGSPARKELAELKQAARALGTEQAKLNSELSKSQRILEKQPAGSAAYKEAAANIERLTGDLATNSAALGTNKARQGELREQIGVLGLSLNELRARSLELRRTMAAGVLNKEALETNARELAEIELRLKAVSTAHGRELLLWEEDRKGMDIARMSLRELNLELERWKIIQETAQPGTEVEREAQQAITATTNAIKERTSAQEIALRAWENERKDIALTSMSLEQLALEEERLRRVLASPDATPQQKGAAAGDLRAVIQQQKDLKDGSAALRQAWEEERKTIDLEKLSLEQLRLEQERYQRIINAPDTSDADRAEAVRGMQAATEQVKRLTDAETILTRAWEEERKGIALTSMSLEQLAREQERYRRIIADPATSDDDRFAANRGLQEATDRLEQLTKSSRIAADEWARMRGQFKLDDLSIEQLKREKEHLEGVRAKLSQTAPELARVENELLAVDKALEGATKQSALYDRQWERTRKDIRLSEMSIQELEREIKYLHQQMATTRGTDLAGLTSLRRQADAAERQLAKLRSGLGPLGQAWQQVKGQVMGAGAVLGTLFAGGAIFQGIRNLVSGSAQISDELADVQKVTGLTTEEVRKLNSELTGINTRTATSALRGIAVGLGQAGEEVNAAAVEAIDKIVLALGSEFGASTNEITNTVSVLRNNLQDIKSGDYAEDVGRIGNAILVLGQSGLATAPVVSDIANRISGVGGQFGVTSGQILGTAAAFQELGISTERGSTAYTKLLQKMSVAPQAFADVVRRAGGDAEEFTRLVNTDIQAAFLIMAKAAKTAGAENTEFGAILKELETSGAGVSELLSKVGANTELFAQKARIATEALESQNAINEQARLANETLAAQIEKLGKLIHHVFTSSTVIGWIESVVSGLTATAQWMQRNVGTLTLLGSVLLKVIAVWASYRIGALAATAASKLFGSASLFAARLTAIFSGQINLATRASQLFALAWRTNPLGLIASGLVIAYEAFTTFRDILGDATDAVRELSAAETELREQQVSMDALFARLKDTNISTEERRRLIAQINDQYGKYIGYQVSEFANLDNINKAQLAANDALLKNIELEAKRTVLQEKLKAATEAQVEVERAKEELEKAKASRNDFSNVAGRGAALTGETSGDRKVSAAERALAARIAQAKKLADDYQKAYSGMGADLLPPPPTTNAGGGTLKSDGDGEQESREGTIAAYEKRIAELREQQKNVATDHAKYAAIDEEIKRYEKLIASITGVSKGAGKSSTDLSSHLDAIKKLLGQHEDELYESLLNADNRELHELANKHAEERTQLESHQQELLKAGMLTREQANAQMLQLEQLQGQQELALIKQQGDRRRMARAEVDALYRADREQGLKELEDIEWQAHLAALDEEVEQWMDLAEKAQTGGAEYYRILDNLRNAHQRQNEATEQTELEAEEAAWNERITKLLTQSALDAEGLKSLEDAKGAAIDRIRRKWAKKAEKDEQADAAARKARMQQDLQNWQARASAFGQFAGAMSNLYATLQSVEEQKADADGVRTREEIERINRMEKRRIAWAKAEIALNTAVGIMNAVKSGSEYGYPWGLIITALGIASVLAGAAQAWAQLGKAGGGGGAGANGAQGQPALQNVPLGEKGFAALPEPRRAAKGVPALRGPSHANGGLDVVDTNTGATVAHIEGGEAVINKEVTRANPELIREMMDAAHRTDKRVQGGHTGSYTYTFRKGGTGAYGIIIPERFRTEVRSAIGWRQQPPRTVGDALQRGMPLTGASTAPRPPNPVRVASALAPRYANGGIIGQPLAYSAYESGPSADRARSADARTDLSETNQLLRQLIGKTDENTEAVRRHRKVVFRPDTAYDRAMDDWERQKGRHRVGRGS